MIKRILLAIMSIWFSSFIPTTIFLLLIFLMAKGLSNSSNLSIISCFRLSLVLTSIITMIKILIGIFYIKCKDKREYFDEKNRQIIERMIKYIRED